MNEQQSSGAPKPTHDTGTGRGEDKAKEENELGRQDTGMSGAGRPTGTSAGRDSTGINPQELQDPSSPHLPTP